MAGGKKMREMRGGKGDRQEKDQKLPEPKQI